MVEVTVGWGAELQSTETDIVKRLIVNAESLVRVLDQLVNRECRIVRLQQRLVD